MEEVKPLTFSRNLLAGSCTAVVTSLLFTPLDVIKVRLQNQTNPLFSQARSDGSIGIMKQIVKTEGLRSLWRGLTPSLVLAVPSMGSMEIIFLKFSCSLFFNV